MHRVRIPVVFVVFTFAEMQLRNILIHLYVANSYGQTCRYILGWQPVWEMDNSELKTGCFANRKVEDIQPSLAICLG